MNKPLLGVEGAPIVAGDDDVPNDDSERCEACGGPLNQPPGLWECATCRADVGLGSPIVATPDGVFVGGALENHQRATQAPRPARVTSIAGRVDREIRLMGALAEIVKIRDDSSGVPFRLSEAIERARTLLVEGDGKEVCS